jgi:hypothetical protein
LLRLVPAVNLVYKKNSPFAVKPPPLIRTIYRFPDILDAGKNRIETFKGAFCGIGNDPGKTRLSSSRRTIEYY